MENKNISLFRSLAKFDSFFKFLNKIFYFYI